jgi:hypothetical protein
MGGFSDSNNLCIDQRGFKVIIQAEAAEFLQPSQVSLNSTVTSIEYSSDGVKVTLADSSVLSSDYVICTFSVGVLQYGDVTFNPALPAWKVEAIQNMVMVSLLKYRYFCQLTVHRLHIPKSSCNSRRSSGSTLRYVYLHRRSMLPINASGLDGCLCRQGTGEISNLAEP